MRSSTRTIVLAFIAAVMMGIPCMAQDAEPPFTWEGKGAASYISEQGIKDTDFEFELSVDEQGMAGGQASYEEGASKIKHVFYSEPQQHDWPGYFSRKIIIVLLINEGDDYPLLAVYNGRLLLDKFLYGEILLTGYEADSEMARALGVGDPEATLVEADQLPAILTSALKKCLPIGTVKIEGDYRGQEPTTAADGDTGSAESQQGGVVTLFNRKDIKDGYAYSKDPEADLKSMWKVEEGILVCKGEPTGFLRTKKEYSDFKLSFEWRWPEKPGNSGVLVRMSGEDKIWPLCMEAQLMHTRAGDIVGMGCYFNENVAQKGSPVSYAPRKNESNEKKPGDWNKYEIVCRGDTMELTVNGQLQNKATGVGVRKGYIGFQSEGVPISFRNIRLTPLN